MRSWSTSALFRLASGACVPPRVLPGVVSHAGELSPGMIKLIEVLIHEASLQYSQGPLTMGMSRKRHTGAFRTRLKDAVMAVNAAGFGRALAPAGNPMGGGLQDVPVRP